MTERTMIQDPDIPPQTMPADREAAHPLSAAFGVLAEHWRVPEADIGAMEPGFTLVAALFADDRFLAAMLARQQAGTPGLDAKGAAAYLVTEYAGLIGIVGAACFLGAGVVPDLDPDRCALALAPPPEGQRVPRVRLRFLQPGFATDRPENGAEGAGSDGARLVDHAGLQEALGRGLEDHFAPLIERLWATTALPRRAMWRLVADAVAARFLEAGRLFGSQEEGRADALAVLKRPGSPLANPQLHFFEIVIRDDHSPGRILASRTFRARGGCCRFYTAPGGSLCSTCVLLDAAERDSRLEANLRRRLGLTPPAGASGAGA